MPEERLRRLYETIQIQHKVAGMENIKRKLIDMEAIIRFNKHLISFKIRIKAPLFNTQQTSQQ